MNEGRGDLVDVMEDERVPPRHYSPRQRAIREGKDCISQQGAPVEDRHVRERHKLNKIAKIEQKEVIFASIVIVCPVGHE